MERDEPNGAGDTQRLECARCGRALLPGHGMLYEVNIHCVADPFPPVLPDWDVATIRRHLEQTLAALHELTSEEALNQVYRNITVHLCNACFDEWIQDPAGRS